MENQQETAGGDDSNENQVTTQMASLQHEVATMTERFRHSRALLRDKEEETEQLREKLLALEIAVQNLFDYSHARSSGCCSQACRIC